MNSKKFTAAEKHFMKKEEALRKQLKSKDDALTAAAVEIADLTRQRNELETQLRIARESIRVLREMTGLSPEEIDAHIKDTQKAAENAAAIKGLLGFAAHGVYGGR